MKALNLLYKRIARMALCLLLLLCVSSVSSGEDVLSEESLFEEELYDSPLVSDPFERVNRIIFSFNDLFYTYAGDPLAGMYQRVPLSARSGIGNFFDNLQYPVRLTGNLLQGRVSSAWHETRRFALNSTLGLLGLLDSASQVDGLQKIESEDVGQALASWGIGEGPYLILPIMGPSNIRDFGGLLGDRFVNPWVDPYSILDPETQLVYGIGDNISSLPVHLNRYREMKSSAIDPYSALKNAYTQYRRGSIER